MIAIPIESAEPVIRELAEEYGAHAFRPAAAGGIVLLCRAWAAAVARTYPPRYEERYEAARIEREERSDGLISLALTLVDEKGTWRKT